MKRNQRVLALVLVVCMIFTAIPTRALAAEAHPISYETQLGISSELANINQLRYFFRLPLRTILGRFRLFLQVPKIDISIEEGEDLEIKLGQDKDLTLTSKYKGDIKWKVSTSRGVSASISPSKSSTTDGTHTASLNVKAIKTGPAKLYVVATDASRSWIKSTKTIKVNVVNQDEEVFNNPPIALDDQGSGTAGQSLRLNVLVNDYDPDGDPLTIDSFSQVAGLEIIKGDGYFDLKVDEPGEYSFTYKISDGKALSNEATVRLTFIEPIPSYVISIDKRSASTTEAEAGTIITITANEAPEGQVFKEWALSHELNFVEGTSKTSPEAKFEMPGADVSIEALYENMPTPKHSISIDKGTASATEAEAGTIITITAGDAPEGQAFKEWTLSYEVNFVEGTSKTSPEAKFEMPDCQVQISANFEELEEDKLTYLALGDSIPFGKYYTSAYQVGTQTGIDTNSYIEQLSLSLGVEAENFYNKTVSGHHPQDVLNQLNDPDLADKVSEADLITLCVGANDIMGAVKIVYQGFLNLDSYMDKYSVDWVIADQGRDNFETYWYQVIDGIEELNPDVTLIVMTIYNPYRTSEDIYGQINPYFENTSPDKYGLNYIIRNTASLYDDYLEDDFDFRVADVYQAFNNHANKDSLTNFYSSFCDPHPNQAGQNEIFDVHYNIYQ